MHKPTKDEALSIIRELPSEQAFYFYNAVGIPTGEVAKDLSQFIEICKIIDAHVLEFHLYRGDFENWVSMLGDDTLRQQLANLKKLELWGETLRRRLLQALRLRNGYLRKIAYRVRDKVE